MEHTDDIAVNNFAATMREKMRSAREKGRSGWDDKSLCTAEVISQMVREHVEKGDPMKVATFCMMLHQRGERIVSEHLGPGGQRAVND